MAVQVGLDLVEMDSKANPPVCKILDYGKYKYSQQKKLAETRKKQKEIEIKEIKFRPNTGIHDYEVKLRNVLRFLENGDYVKITMRFRGRELAHQSIGLELLERVRDDVSKYGKVIAQPKFEGRQIHMLVSPSK